MDKAFGEGGLVAIKGMVEGPGKGPRDRGTTMGSALRVLLALLLMVSVGLSACGRRGSLDRPKPAYPEAAADPSTKMSKVPARSLWIDRLLQ